MRVELARLAKGTLIYGLGGVLNRFIGFLLLPLFTSYLTPAEYGIAAILDMVGRRVEVADSLLHEAEEAIPARRRNGEPADKDLEFVRQRVQRLRNFRDRAQGFFASPLVRMILKK